MNFKRLLYKATALSASLVIGMSAVGAYDLGSYPTKFVENGKFSGKIVLGEQANVEDVLGAVDITASLQASSATTTEPVFHGVVLSGDAKAINGGKLQLRKKPSTTLTANDIKAFARGSITTSSGTTEYDQYLRVGATGLQQATVNYVRNKDGALDEFFVLGDTTPFFEWEIRFPDGLKSQRETDGALRDLQDVTLGIVGNNATVVAASIAADGTDFSMTLMGGSASDTLREGETKTYTIDGKSYEITLVFVSDPNVGTPEVKLSVNGEMTHSLAAGDTDMLSDGLQIGIRDILVNNREGAAGVYIGARKMVFTDPTPSTEDFDGSVEVNGQHVPESPLQVVGDFDATNSTYRLSWMKYRYTVNGKDGSPVYMSEDRLLRSVIKMPEGMLSDIDFHYHGILPVDAKNFTITKDAEEQYRVTFYNVDGKKYAFPLLSNRNGVWKYGDDKDDLIFIEGANSSDHTIGINDYFILSNNRGTTDADKSATHVLRYQDYNPSTRTLYFDSQSDHKVIKVPVSRNGIGYLIPGSHINKVNVSDIDASQPNLSIDLDANSAYGNTIKVVTYGGVVINLAQTVYLNDTQNTTLSDGNITTIVGNGKRISDATNFVSGSGFVQMNAQVLAKKFDTPSTDESFNWSIVQASNNKVDLTMSGAAYAGPLHTDLSDDNNGYLFTTSRDDSYHLRGLTDYGIFIDLHQNADHPTELALNIPQTERYTQMFITIGQIIHGGTPAGTTQKINPIAVGMAVLDINAPAVDKENMIVIGGPCVNKIAQQLLNTSDDCAGAFTPGSAMIKSFENDGKVAILVAGYEAADTLRASEALAKYKTADLEGEAMDIPSK